MLTQERAHKLFSYDPWTGDLFNRIDRGRSRVGMVAGCLNGSGYLQTRVEGKIYLNHRIIFLYLHGYLPKNIDHADGDPLNNRAYNLRGATDCENARNKKISKNNKSGYKGVYYNKSASKWQATIMENRKNIYLGCFETPEEAHETYCRESKKHHKNFARFN